MNCINKHKADCCGCTACAKICAYGAINMQADVLGFKYPIVDSKRCVDCGLCVKVCQFKNNYESFINAIKLYKYYGPCCIWRFSSRYNNSYKSI